MAMVNCPNCGESVSDKAEKCIHCGTTIKENVNKKCSECGAELENGASVCPKCGCPVKANETSSIPQQVEVTNVQVSKKTTKKIIMGVCLAIVCVLGFFVIQNINATNANKKYEESYKAIVNDMFMGGVEAEECANLIEAVWRDTIKDNGKNAETQKYVCTSIVFRDGSCYVYDDFNESLRNLFADSSFSAKISSISSNQTKVKNAMKNMKNPPESWKEAYDDLMEFYDIYVEFTNLATSPTGSYNTYSSSFGTLDSSFARAYDKVKLNY